MKSPFVIAGKTAVLGLVLSVVGSIFSTNSTALSQTRRNEPPLTNTSVIKLVKAGFKEKTVIAIISSRPSTFDLSTERMIELKRNGVSERIILAMLGHQVSLENDDFWSDDPSFNNTFGSNNNTGSTGNGNSIDLFGSSGGAKGSSKSNGVKGSLEGDTVTTGSATVRILRSGEANAPAKLEKTPTLTNDSIVELVEAGFSEGTIIRRIEQSPVEFDLSTVKISDLRRRRVSEKVLDAMKLAMGTGNGSSSNETPR